MKKLLRKIYQPMFYTLTTLLVSVCIYLAVSIVGSLTMLSTSYMLFVEWPVWVRFLYISFCLYILVRALIEDVQSWGNGN